jgi:hypothetical protein
MEELKQIKNQILELHKAWDAISDDDDSLDGLKDAECIESDVQHLIINYCKHKHYDVNGLTIEKPEAIAEKNDDDLFPYERNRQYLEQLALTHDDVAQLLWFYYHTFWPEIGLWVTKDDLIQFIK